ncbi:proteasome non-ATPase 26S subunit [Toxoplasma gondii RUB]|uniref:Proteasome non-ATPase 26S subunit n=6 Tax=Toxoplasma gondii TaxID=5811 RepID=S7USY0_TOXGG|nr:hypothetical protein TGGT1_306910 [Toxoplasma gondii GT1]KAF4639068.1 hypothetical protein TGRH88_048400 [Toxoplasma gondii]KFG56827.1 proteasome non-ATPase 26S subunit [Toxoplasma gondii RUB]KFG99460.1 proteasome non-ATPase 26S subunit [Toxoplasma gondii VAND]RQX72236.1 proteasome non-ATPase 26S subunit [Toxoplasma gondii CAST]
MLSAFDHSSQAAAPRVASLAALTAFVDSPQTSQALEEFRQHISPGELVLQTAQTAAQTAGRVKAELGENEESEELVIVVRALRKCLAYDGVLENVVREPQLRRVLIDAAESGSTLLRRLLVQQLGKLIGQGSAGVELAIEAKLYELLPGLLGDPDVGVASDAAKAIVASLESRQGCQAFSSPEFFQSLMAAAASPDEMVKVRTLALFVEAGRKNETVFNELADRGAFTVLVNSFATDDLLLKISLVALIEQLASYRAGAKFLALSSIPRQLVGELAEDSVDETSRVSLVHAIAELIKQQPEIGNEMFQVQGGSLAKTLVEFQHSVPATPQEKSDLCCAIAAWGSIASSPLGYEAVQKAAPTVGASISSYFTGETEIANLAMDAWSNVLNSLPDPLAPDVESKLKSLAESVCHTHVSRPFGESRAHSYPLLTALCRSRLAVQTIMGSEEIRRSLVDPFSDDSSDAKYAKNAFIKKLAADHLDWLRTVIEESYLTKLKTFADAGPFYIPPGTAVPTINSTWV